MSTTEEQKQEQKQETKVDTNSESTAFWERLGKEVTQEFKKYIEAQIKSDVCEDDGIVYHFNKVKGKNILEFKRLDAESFKIEDKNSQQFYDNVKARACMLIKDMTPEKFDEGVYSTLENLTTAWSRRQEGGFCLPKPSISSVL